MMGQEPVNQAKLPSRDRVATTRHQQLSQQLRQRIRKGELVAGQPLPSESELCQQFKVSRGPVRQALSSLIREGLIFRLPGKGSFVSEHINTRPRESQSLRRIRILIDASGPMDENFCVLEILEGLNQAADDLSGRCRLDYSFHRFASTLDTEGLDLISGEDCDGVLVVPFTFECVNLLSSLHSPAIPIVSFYQALGSQAISHIYIDHQAAARRATEYLIRFGHRRIILLLAAEAASRQSSSKQRLDGYRQALSAHQIGERLEITLPVAADSSAMQRAMEPLWADPCPPTAILVGGGLLTPSICQWLSVSGLRVPEELSVIAFDDVSAAMLHKPSLSVVKQPLIPGIKAALQRLWHELDYPYEPAIGSALIPEIVLRDSCGPAPLSASRKT